MGKKYYALVCHSWERDESILFFEQQFTKDCRGKFHGYKFSRMPLPMQFRGDLFSRTAQKFAKSRKFVPAKICTIKECKKASDWLNINHISFQKEYG